MKNTVIFDMDGVIVDTEPLHMKAFYQHFKELDVNVDLSFYSMLTGMSTKNVYQLLKESFDLDGEVEDIIPRKREIFYDLFDNDKELKLLDGVEELIKNLHANGFQLILASSAAKTTIERIFKRFNLYPYFKHIISGEDFPESKPHPAIFIKAQKISGEKKEQCLVIEDSANGIQAAKLAGLYCVGYKSKNTKKQNYDLADLVIEDFSELTVDKVRNLN